MTDRTAYLRLFVAAERASCRVLLSASMGTLTCLEIHNRDGMCIAASPLLERDNLDVAAEPLIALLEDRQARE